MNKTLFKSLLLATAIVASAPCFGMDNPELISKSVQIKDGQLLQISPTQNKKDKIEALLFIKKFFHYASLQYDHKIICAHLTTPKGPVLVGVTFFRHPLQAPEDIIVTHLVVSDDFQKKGIGRELVDYIAQETRCKTMLLTSSIEAVGFYSKMGFEEGKKKGEMRKDFSL